MVCSLMTEGSMRVFVCSILQQRGVCVCRVIWQWGIPIEMQVRRANDVPDRARRDLFALR